MKPSDLPTSYSRAAARALNCTRGHIGLCAIILMLMMSTLVWRQRDLVAVKLPVMEQRPPMTLDSKAPTIAGINGTLDRFWSSNGESVQDLVHWSKPKGVDKILGLVFYGRRQSVSILDCYLKVQAVHAEFVTSG